MSLFREMKIFLMFNSPSLSERGERRLLTKILSGSCKKSAQFLLEGGGEEYFKALTMPTDEVGEGEKLSKDEESDEVVVIEW